MSELQRAKILASVYAEDFIGRTAETDKLLQHARSENTTRGFSLLSAPALGSSEILKQIYDQLFYDRSDIIPFYFAFKKNDQTALQTAVRFLQNFLQQTVAFRHQNPKILDISPEVCELAQIAAPSDGHWIDRLIENCQTESRLGDDRSFIRQALSAPLRAAAHNAKFFVMLDDLHEAEHFSSETDFVAELKTIFARSEMPFVFSGRRRFLFNEIDENFILQDLKPLSLSDAEILAGNLANKFAVKINEQTKDLIAVQMQGSPLFTRFLFQAASEKKIDLDSFQKVERVYTDEIFGGRIGGFYEKVFNEISSNIETQKNIVGVLYDALTVEKEKNPVESWRKRFDLPNNDFYKLVKHLNINEIIRVSSNQTEAMNENEILSDYLRGRFRLETIGENRALVVSEMLSEFLKRAPQTMAKLYRRNSAIGLRELLAVFDCQEIPQQLIDYSAFKDELKGAPNNEILKFLNSKTGKIKLPQIVYTAHTAAFYPAIEQVVEKERAAVAIGFVECSYTDEDQTVWLAAEIDSKLEARKDLTEFWCDRLEMVALMCNFLNYKIWLVAPEGFSPEAIEILKQRNAFGSSKKQVELLIEFLGAKEAVNEKLQPNEYEIIVPMGEDTEMIAAQTVEEIARRHNFAPRAINQIKTALVEACINATEHSLSPDRKIYQKFAVEDDKIVITISNRGLRLADKNAGEITTDEGRRGWGLKLIKSLMDEVKFEQTDDGTRISMTKFLVK
ncbi:MAG: ATP-binding protein [Pyrinomonadaceae bacterium]